MKRASAYAEEIAAAMVMLALFATSGCTSDKAFVANSSAARLYYESRYARKCVEVVGPVDACKKSQAALNLLEHHEPKGCDVTLPTCIPVGLIPVASKVQKIGKLPKDAKTEISDTLKLVKVP